MVDLNGNNDQEPEGTVTPVWRLERWQILNYQSNGAIQIITTTFVVFPNEINKIL